MLQILKSFSMGPVVHVCVVRYCFCNKAIFPSKRSFISSKIYGLLPVFLFELSIHQLITFLKVSVGMDLTKVTLPTFILERRSLLEMYADFFAHPDNFIVTTSLSTPEERMISVVKYYLGAFYAARKSGVAKKPYNPILGETFRCKQFFFNNFTTFLYLTRRKEG